MQPLACTGYLVKEENVGNSFVVANRNECALSNIGCISELASINMVV